MIYFDENPHHLSGSVSSFKKTVKRLSDFGKGIIGQNIRKDTGLLTLSVDSENFLYVFTKFS